MAGASTLSGVSWVVGFITAGGQEVGGARVTGTLGVEVQGWHSCRQGSGLAGTSMAGGTGLEAPLLVLPSSPWLWALLESGGHRPVCSLPCSYCLFWGNGPSHLQPGVQDGRHCFHCCLSSTSSMYFSPPTFRCTDVWGSLASCCAGIKKLCSVTDVLLVGNWSRETKRVSHATVRLDNLYNFLNLFTSWGTFESFQFWTIMNNLAVNICIQVLCGHMFSPLLGQHLGVDMMGCIVSDVSTHSPPLWVEAELAEEVQSPRPEPKARDKPKFSISSWIKSPKP